MKKLLIILSTITLLVGCKKDLAPSEQISKKVTVPEQGTYISSDYPWFIGDPTRTPDLAPISLEKDYWGATVGVRTEDGTYPFVFQGYSETNDQNGTWLRYRCPVENIGVASKNFYSPLLPYPGDTHYSGADFIYQFHRDSAGVYRGITNPKFLYRVVFQNGIPISLPGDNYKVDWEGLDLQEIYNFNPSLNDTSFLNYHHFSSSDTGTLHPMFHDEYQNDLRLPDNPLGKYVGVITINPEDYVTHERLFRENDYSNNTVTLPIQINGLGLAVVDTTALADNKPLPVDSLRYTLIGQGRNRQVQLNWFCPYHQYKGVIHKFTIKKNKKIIADNLWTEGYLDTSGSKTNVTYEVSIKIEGLGASDYKSIVVKNK